MLKAILLSSVLAFVSGQYTHWTDKAREFRCRNLEKLYEKHKNRPFESFTPKEIETGRYYHSWYQSNCSSK